MNINDKINALVSIKHWAVERQMYEIVTLARDVERSLLEVAIDYIKVIKPLEYLSNEQKEFLLGIQIFNSLPKERLRDLKLILILT
jgi:hypothetical protein